MTPGRVVSFFTTVGAFVFFCRGIDLGTIHKWCNTHQSFLSPPSSMSSLYALSHCPGVMPLRTLPPLKRDFYLLLKKKSKTMFSSHHTSLVVSMLENNQKKKFFFNTFCVDLFPIVWVWAPCSAHPYLRRLAFIYNNHSKSTVWSLECPAPKCWLKYIRPRCSAFTGSPYCVTLFINSLLWLWVLKSHDLDQSRNKFQF